MSKTKFILVNVFLYCILIINTGEAQHLKKVLRKADKAFNNYDYNEAISLYKKVISKDTAHLKANYRIAKCYLHTRIHKHNALKYLKRVYNHKSDFGNIKMTLAIAYQQNNEFDKALGFFIKERKNIDTTTKKGQYHYSLLGKYIYECKMGKKYKSNPVDVKIENLGSRINTKYPDYAPVISADESILVFTSRRPSSKGEIYDDGYKSEDLFISFFREKRWTIPHKINSINTKGHDASIAMAPDGSKIFIYKGKNNGDIYVSDLKHDKWSKPESIGDNINTKYAEPSVSMSYDGNTIYFSSKRPGGEGGLDIYKSTLNEKGKWKEPVNVGPVINTPFDEDAPFIHPNGKYLYFSSQGHTSMGGYDIFKSKVLGDSAYSKPENLGYPINTASNDLYFVLSADNKHGYYASFKESGYGEQDIYRIKMPKAVKKQKSKDANTTEIADTLKIDDKKDNKKEADNPITILKGKVVDAQTGKPLKAKVTLTNNKANKKIKEVNTRKSDGSFLVIMESGKNYGIAVEKQDYVFHSDNFDIPSSEDFQKIEKTIKLKKVKKGATIELNNIFFDKDKATLRDYSLSELNRIYDILKKNRSLKIQIIGHTDSLGSKTYNKKLSEKRAKAVVEYLKKKGIDKNRLSYKGVGESRPIADNKTSKGRQKNRRTEFKIIEK